LCSLKGGGLILVVYVLNKHGKPLMPCKPSKARKYSSICISLLPIYSKQSEGGQPMQLVITEKTNTHRGRTSVPVKRELPTHVVTVPNQVWTWDILG
jgi:hypothetical protein